MMNIRRTLLLKAILYKLSLYRPYDIADLHALLEQELW